MMPNALTNVKNLTLL